MIGIGLSITNVAMMNQHLRQGDPPVDVLVSAMAGKQLVDAKYEGADLILAPYALFRSDDGKDVFLLAVVLRSTNAALNAWEPQQFDVRKLVQERAREDTFLPSQAFDPLVYGDRLMGHVDLG